MSAIEVSIHKAIPAPLASVWEAFTSTEGLASWWWRHWDDVTITADVRVGGSYRIEAPAAGITLTGDYADVDAQKRVAYSWNWTDADGTNPTEHVVVTFSPAPGGTEVTVVHSGDWADAAAGEPLRQGWEFTLGELAAVLSET